MHVLKVSQPIPRLDGTGIELPAGEWLMTDDNAFKLALRAEMGDAEVKRCAFDDYDRAENKALNRSPDEGETFPKSILLIRSGAIGDLLLLSPCIEPLRKKYPNSRIYLACHKRHNPLISDFGITPVHYPVNMESVMDFDLIIPLEYTVEKSTELGIHATDAFAAALGVTVEDYRPVYKVTHDEFTRTDHTARLDKAPRIALQLHASSMVRNYPLKQWFMVISLLVKNGWEVMLIGNQDGLRGVPPQVKDCSKLSFREAAAVLASCDVFCGVDSSFFNLCPAFGVPAIGLFGPVDWRTRIKDVNTQTALHVDASCAPCGWTNSRGGVKFPAHGPCAKSGQCEPLAAIEPERIVAVIERHRK